MGDHKQTAERGGGPRVEIHYRDKKTGETAVYVPEYQVDAPDLNIRWYYVSGNYGCDCNRGMHFDLDLSCNREANRIRMTKMIIDDREYTEDLNDGAL